MRRYEKTLVRAVLAFAIFFAVTPEALAMHVMEGYLPAKYCVAWGIICIPFLVVGILSLKKQVKADRRAMTLIAMSGAFIFVISSLKIPSVTGSSSHMTGTGLGALLFGPAKVSVLGFIVLLFQAVLLAHGGVTTLGANTFSMAIAGPLFSFGINKIGTMLNINKKITIFLSAFLGSLFTYCVTAVQLGIAYPKEVGGMKVSILKFLGVFAPTQLPLAVIEGILTLIFMLALETYAGTELRAIGYSKEGQIHE